MFSVPGKYSGGEGNGFSWTQTLQEVSVRAPLPAGTPDGVVRCSFAARRIEMSWEGLECPVPADELNAVIVVDDSLWVVEKDGAEAAVILTLQKAVPTIWDRLFTSAAALPTAPPTLLDAPERTAAPTKQELLRQAKERLGDELDGPSRAKPHVLEGLVDEQRTLSLGMDGLPELPVIIVRGCKGCTITLAPELALIKVQIEHCKQCSVDVQSRCAPGIVEQRPTIRRQHTQRLPSQPGPVLDHPPVCTHPLVEPPSLLHRRVAQGAEKSTSEAAPNPQSNPTAQPQPRP